MESAVFELRASFRSGPTSTQYSRAQRGCPICADRGISPAKPGYLYIVVSDEHRALKWGIANIEQRLNQHVTQGWELAARSDFDLTGDAWAFERQIKIWIRGQGIPKALTADQMKYRGHTETALLVDISCRLSCGTSSL